ncbi:MAG: class I SAM-dependent methyltransferase [Alphaproteobacteria bacterium]
MGDFDTAWLDLREPYDRHALNKDVLNEISRWSASFGKPLRIVDLGCGTGAAFRHLHEHLPAGSRWTAVDGDHTLLDHAVARTQATPLRCNLAIGLSFIPFNAFDLVTASAFIDLVSEQWLDKLVGLITKNRCAVWLPMAATKKREWAPPDEADDRMSALFNDHMKSDKGFGPALGCDAADCAEKKLRDAGYRVFTGNSDWVLEQRSADLQLALLHGYREALLDAGIEDTEWLDTWTDHRRSAIDAHQSTHIVGHRDLFAVPQ